MTLCHHCFTDSATLRWQAERIEYLEGQLREARVLLRGPPVPCDLLTRAEEAIVGVLLAHEQASHELLRECYQHIDGVERVNRNTIAVLIARARTKLAPLGVRIENVWGYGYRIPREDRAKLKEAA